MAVPYCIHCGAQFPSGGYCDESPDGEHEVAINEDAVNPYDCCPDCGAKLDRAEIDGFAEHVCDPADLAAQRDQEEEAIILNGTGEPEPIGVLKANKRLTTIELAAVLGVLQAPYIRKQTGKDWGSMAVWKSPTKKVKEESKTRRKMAKASRKKNRK